MLDRFSDLCLNTDFQTNLKVAETKTEQNKHC